MTILVPRRLCGVGVREKVVTMLDRVMVRAATVTHHLDAAGFRTWFQRSFGREIELETAQLATQKNGDPTQASAKLLELYEAREADLTADFLRRVESYLLLKTIDDKWRDHLAAIDALKAGIGLRGYGQVDPKNEYKREGFQLFGKLLEAIEDEVTSLVMRIEIQRPAQLAPSAPQPRLISPVGRPTPPPTPTPPPQAARVQRRARHRAEDDPEGDPPRHRARARCAPHRAPRGGRHG